MSNWQPIETAPDNSSPLLLGIAGGGSAFSGSYSETEGEWINDGGYVIYPTHWMPLPKPPKPLICIKGTTIPVPLSELHDGDIYYLVDLSRVRRCIGESPELYKERLTAGLCHATEAAAEQHRQYLLSFTKENN